jgi:hypothetical protein
VLLAQPLMRAHNASSDYQRIYAVGIALSHRQFFDTPLGSMSEFSYKLNFSFFRAIPFFNVKTADHNSAGGFVLVNISFSILIPNTHP